MRPARHPRERGLKSDTARGAAFRHLGPSRGVWETPENHPSCLHRRCFLMTKVSGPSPSPQNIRTSPAAPPVAPPPPAPAAPKSTAPALPSTAFVGGAANPFTPRVDTPVTPSKLERPPKPEVQASRELALPATRTSGVTPI